MKLAAFADLTILIATSTVAERTRSRETIHADK